MDHSSLVNHILLMIGKEFPHIRAWKNHTGTTKIGDRFLKFGLVGSADILGLVAPTGRFMAIECKTGTGRQTPEQKNFEKMILDYGGAYTVGRDLGGVYDFLENLNCTNKNFV